MMITKPPSTTHPPASGGPVAGHRGRCPRFGRPAAIVAIVVSFAACGAAPTSPASGCGDGSCDTTTTKPYQTTTTAATTTTAPAPPPPPPTDETTTTIAAATTTTIVTATTVPGAVTPTTAPGTTPTTTKPRPTAPPADDVDLPATK